MPSNIIPATPTDVFPQLPASAFTEELRIEANVNNNYPDGSSDRAPLVQNPRRFFKITAPVITTGNPPKFPPQWDTLRKFYFAHIGVPFYFYFGRETVPPYSQDPTGQNTVGRYTVVFDGGYSDGIAMGRSTVSFGLREVQ
jgi:hypothetical protein